MMIIKFKGGKKIKFKKFGKIWLADSVIWEKTNLHGSLEDLRVLKAVIAEWFTKNAPEELADRFTARLPMFEEFKRLPFKDQVAYREGKTDQISRYLLGDEYDISPLYCYVGHSDNYYGWFSCYYALDDSTTCAIRLCLEEKE